jgi:hypothetical protein
LLANLKVYYFAYSRWQVARDIVRNEGVRGLTRGLGLTIIREVPAFGSYFFAYETFYKYGNQHYPAYPTAVTMVSTVNNAATVQTGLVCRRHGWCGVLGVFLSK